MELTSENDLFFHYTHSLDEQGFRLVQEQQKLMVDFAEYAAVLIRMLNTCIKVLGLALGVRLGVGLGARG